MHSAKPLNQPLPVAPSRPQVVIAHSLTDLLAFATGTPDDQLPRLTIQCAIVLCVLLPLCLMPSLKPLAAASMFGVAGTSVTAVAMLARLYDGSYEPEGDFFEVVRWTPVFEPSAATDVFASAAASSSASTSATSTIDDGADGMDGDMLFAAGGGGGGGAGGGSGAGGGGGWWSAAAAQLAVAPSAGNVAFFLSLTSNACAAAQLHAPHHAPSLPPLP